jgi:hypothetical protein
MAKNLSKTTTDHDQIRRWTEERGGWPAEVESTAREGQAGILRIDFPGWSGEGKLRRIEWDEWFRKFDETGLAFVYEEETSGGQRSNFNKLVARETAEARARGVRTSRRHPAGGRGASRARSGGRSSSRGGARGTSRGGSRSTSGRSAGSASRSGGSAARRGARSGARAGAKAGKRAGARAGARAATRSTGRRQASRAAAARTAGGRAGRGGGRSGSPRGGARQGGTRRSR